MQPLEEISASYGGKILSFRIGREDIAVFEAAFRKPAFDTLKRLLGGEWTMRDVFDVLAFAQYRTSDELRRHVALGLPIDGIPVAMPSDLSQIVAAVPSARLALLAAKILEATLLGVGPDEAEVALDG